MLIKQRSSTEPPNNFGPIHIMHSNDDRFYDQDGSGTLSFKEWCRAMKSLDYRMQKNDKVRLFNLIDRDRSGTISGELVE